MTAGKRPPVVPKDLGAAGRRLWSAIVADYLLDPAELGLLLEACRTVDELGRLGALLAKASPVVAGSAGQDRANPLFDEVRRHRETLARLVVALRIPDREELVGQAPGSVAAQRAARGRWGRRDTGEAG